MEGYMTIKQTAEEWGVTPRRIQVLCVEGRIEGANEVWKGLGYTH